MLRSFMRSFDRSVEFQLATTMILYVVCGILVIAFGPYQSHGTASTIPPITFHLPLGAFLSLSVLAWQSCLMASNRFSYELHEVTLGQGIISSLFYLAEMAELAPDLVSVYGRRLSLLRYVYWAASMAMLFMVSNSAIAPENATTMTDGKRIRAQIPFILLLLGAGCVWQLHPHPAWQATLLSLAIFSWYRLLLPHMANIDAAAKRTVHTQRRATFAYTAIRAIAFGEWTIYPVVHLLGALGNISVPAEEALQVVADLLSKVFSVAMAQNGVLHVASLRRMKELSALSSPRHSFVPRRHRRATADDSASDEVATAPVADGHSAASDTASVAARAERAHEHTLARAKED